MADQPSKHGEQHHPEGPDPSRLPYFWPLKVDGDTIDVTVRDGALIFEIPKDMAGEDVGNGEIEYWSLVDCEAFITTSGGAVSVQIRNVTQGHDFLSTKISIDSGELNSKDAATPPVVNAGNARVEWGDHIAIDVDTASGKGLGVYLWFDRV
jgi:hypothetical protein